MKILISVLVILALLVLLWWFLSSGKKRKLEEQRAEAASIRAGAQERAGVLQSQEKFAQQSDQRATVARQEAEERARQAEESAREAQRVEDEARQHKDEFERARLAHEAELRRADEIDPDVDVAKDDPRPLPEDLDDDVRPLDDTRVHTPVPAALDDPAPADTLETSSAPEVHSEAARHPAPETADGAKDEDGSWGTGAAAAGAAAAAVGSAYAATHGNVTDDDAAERLASGADYSDHKGQPGENASATVPDSSDEFVSQSAAERSDTDGADAEQVGGARVDTDGADREPVIISDVEDYASTEPLPAESAAPVDEANSADTAITGEESRNATYDDARDDLKQEDGMSAEGSDDRDGLVVNDEPSDHDADGTRVASETADGETVIISDVEDYASTEPLPAESAAPVDEATSAETASTSEESRDATYDDTQDDVDRDDLTSTEDSADRDELVAGDEPITQDASSEESNSEAVVRDEPTTEETWEDPETPSPSEYESNAAVDAQTPSESLNDTDPGGAVAEGGKASDAESDTRAEGERGDATHWPDGTDRINTVDGESANESLGATNGGHSGNGFGNESGSDSDNGSMGDNSEGNDSDNDSDNDSGGDGWSRRISGIEEISDGGYGVGSAAPLEDRAQPAGHPVQAYHDTNTFRVPGVDGYDSAEPDVWFYDEEAARRAGFTPSEG